MVGLPKPSSASEQLKASLVLSPTGIDPHGASHIVPFQRKRLTAPDCRQAMTGRSEGSTAREGRAGLPKEMGIPVPRSNQEGSGGSVAADRSAAQARRVGAIGRL